MPTAVNAFQAEDGTLHDTEELAAAHEALCTLKKTNIFKQETVMAIIEHRGLIYDCLKPIVEAERARSLEPLVLGCTTGGAD